MKHVGFFEESCGVKSSTRLYSFILLLFFCVFNYMYLVHESHALDFDFIFLDGLLLTAVFAPKYLHKLAEMKLGDIKQDAKN